ncbi:MAG TPA: NADAR family protein [Polyangiaceae bacterium]|nr:NADAR family protein [Polyangiaceae bacterium]
MDLYSEDAVFMFHSRSKDAPPGAGVGETLRLPAGAFAALAASPGWRQLLSNFAPAPFALDGLRWPSVEHCFQGSKFSAADPAYYRSFSLDSGSALSQGDGAAAKSAGGRRGRPMTPAQIADWEVRKGGVMRRALEAKFRQNAEHRAVLLATWPAKLTHRPLRSKHTQVEHALMEVRLVLRAEAEQGAAP